MARDVPAWKEKWESLDPKRKKNLVMIGMAAIIGVAMLFAAGIDTKSHRKVEKQVAGELLPRDAARDLGVTAMADEVSKLRADSRKKDDEISRLRNAVGRLPAAGRSDQETSPKELEDLRREVAELRESLGSGAPTPARPSPQSAAATGASAPVSGQAASTPSRPATRSGQPTTPPAPTSPAVDTEYRSPSAPAFGGIRTISAQGASSGDSRPSDPGAVPAARMTDASGNDEKVETNYIPSGSMMTGVVLTGLDAPTGKGAMRDPIPVLVRVKQEAILPNRYRADVRECFLLASGHGDLASERAYLRAVSISCVRHDKKVIDIPVEMYAVGSDGKAGVRGRLVSKQGQVIAKAAAAGLAQGFSQAFSRTRSYGNYGRGGDIDYDMVMQSGATSGVGSAFDRIAKYYLDLADQVFPVIEVDAGQRITFVMVKGAGMGVLR